MSKNISRPSQPAQDTSGRPFCCVTGLWRQPAYFDTNKQHPVKFSHRFFIFKKIPKIGLGVKNSSKRKSYARKPSPPARFKRLKFNVFYDLAGEFCDLSHVLCRDLNNVGYRNYRMKIRRQFYKPVPKTIHLENRVIWSNRWRNFERPRKFWHSLRISIG